MGKFLIDMRLATDRAYRPWAQALETGLARGTSFCAQERREFAGLHPLEDYFFAGLVALQASAAREYLPGAAVQALQRQVALQVDAAAGRADRMVSVLVFIMLGRMSRNAELGLPVPAVEVATDGIFECLAIDRMARTRALTIDPALRKALNDHLQSREVWWPAFLAVYRLANVGSAGGAGGLLGPGKRALPPTARAGSPAAPPLSAFARKLGAWLTPRPHVH